MSTRPKKDLSTAPPPSPTTASSLPIGKLASQTRIFISYHRGDTDPAAAHLHASLARRFGIDRVFRDRATIQPGQDFAKVIDAAISATSVVIALIGRRWLTTKMRGKRHLKKPTDYVGLELESALRHKVQVIPVLVDGARMPTRRDLPASIGDLADRNAWHEGIARLGHRIAQIQLERAERAI